jgi:predicted transposase YdaD
MERFNSSINKVLALLFKHISDEGYIKTQFKNIFALLVDYFGEDKREAVISFLLYIMNTTEIDKTYIKESLNKISPQGGQIAMTTAMKIRQEGRHEGKHETARIMPTNGADVEFVVKVTRLDKDIIIQIQEELEG